MIKRRFILLILLTIGILCSMSFVSLILYFDPYAHKILGVILLILCFLGGVSSIISLGIYFIKKIYYRGEVGMFHVFSSLRQSFLFSLLCVGVVAIIYVGIPILLPTVLLFCLVIFLELFIKSF